MKEKKTIYKNEIKKIVKEKNSILDNKKKNKIDLKKCDNKMKDNIICISSIKEKMDRCLTDSEINALFLGLVKIIKKSAIENVETKLKDDCLKANQNFRQSIIDINCLEEKLRLEQLKNVELSIEIENQREKICSLIKNRRNVNLKV